jgi:uncharacterized repeat protein (TIGR02543 family)
MAGMFAGTREFNQPLNNWDTSNVYDMNAMFYFALKFDNDIHSWDTGNVRDMSNMFAQSSFNQPIGDWDVKNVTNTTSMFYHNLYFNQPIGDWDTHSFGFVNTMFTFASAFNQPIGDWDLTGAIQMGEMLAGATSFNQDVSNWRIPNVYYINGLFNGTAMSDANYSAFLVSMNNQPHYANLSLIAPSKYLCSAADARSSLVNGSNWWIVDGGAAACRDSQTIDFPQPASMGMNKSRILNATATSGLPVSYQWISGPCSVDANVVSASGEGVCVVAAQQSGNDSYDDAMQVLRSISITGAEMPEVVYVANGATSGTAPVDSVGPYIPGDTAVVLGAGDLARPGYQFIGWNTKSDGTGDMYQSNDVVQLHMNDVVLFAQWQGVNPHMVIFDGNGAVGDAPLGASHYEGSDFTLPSATGMSLDHYQFVGWNTSPDGLGEMFEAGSTYTVTNQDVTLFAIWQRVPFTNFSLIAAGSSWTGGAATEIDNGTSITLPTASEVTKPGFVLTGWSRTANGTVEFAPGATYVVDGSNEALYAIWASTQRTVIKKTLSIKFWPYMAILSLGNMKAIRNFVKQNLKGKTRGLSITVYGYVQHTAKGKKIPAPVVAFNESLQKARAKAVIAYLKKLGIKVTYKAKIAESNSTSSAARKATIVATWRS